MTNDKQMLRWLLRVVGAAALLAIPCALMPYAWMDGVHRGLGMGPLPDAPIVGYLARSTSAFYGLLGGLLWAASSDLERFRPILRYLGAAMVVFGLFLIGVDWVEGMPLFWRVWEGPFNVAFGAAILWLARRERA
jgi:hypothetical protein